MILLLVCNYFLMRTCTLSDIKAYAGTSQENIQRSLCYLEWIPIFCKIGPFSLAVRAPLLLIAGCWICEVPLIH